MTDDVAILRREIVGALRDVSHCHADWHQGIRGIASRLERAALPPHETGEGPTPDLADLAPSLREKWNYEIGWRRRSHSDRDREVASKLQEMFDDLYPAANARAKAGEKE